MQEDFEIDLFDDTDEQPDTFQLPMNYITIGQVENDDLKVYIHQDVFKKLESYASSDLEHELGSILLGRHMQSMGKTHVVISNFIEAKYTDASASTLTFTHESWDYIHAQHEEKYPDLFILGWQHTHPGYGIFLSNYDMFIQENFFNLPFQVAYVIDPKQESRGFFQWKNNKVEKLNGFFVYDDVGKPVKVDLSKPAVIPTQNNEQTARRLPPFITVATLALIVILCGATFYQAGRIHSQTMAQDELYSVVNRQNEEIFALQEIITQTSTAPSVPEETTVAPTKDTVGVSFIQYTVKPGDTLYGICKRNGLEYDTARNTILSINGIKDANMIRAGQILILPKYDQ